MTANIRDLALAITLAMLCSCSSAPAQKAAALPPAAPSTAAVAASPQAATPGGGNVGPAPASSPQTTANDVALGVASAITQAVGGKIVDVSNTPDLPSFEAYDGQHLPDSQVAIFRTTKDVLVGLVHDLKGGALYQSAFAGQTHEIRLRPGSYRFTLLVTYDKCGGCQKIFESQFDLTAGHVYVLDKNEAKYFWWTLNESDLSGRPISVEVF